MLLQGKLTPNRTKTSADLPKLKAKAAELAAIKAAEKAAKANDAEQPSA